MPSDARPPAPALRNYQSRTLESLVRGIANYPGATFTVMYPRQAGKNEVAAALVVCLLRANALAGGSVVVCAPTARPQARISLERVRRALGASDVIIAAAGHFRVSGSVIEVGRARAHFLSASPAAHVAGHTASLALIADEAQDIDSDWFNRQFRPMAASTGAPTVLFGTAWNGRTLLEAAAARNRARDACNPLAIPFHYQVGWAEVDASRPGYGAYVRHERERLGANHPLYLSQYELVASDAVGRLLTPGQLARLEGSHPPLDAPLPGERYVAGLDFGGDGEHADATVLTIARVAGDRCEVVRHVAWQGAPYGTVEEDVEALARAWRLERLCADATGLGGPLTAHLASQLGPRLERVAFSAPVKSALGYALIAAAGTDSLSLYVDDGSAESAACRAQLRDCAADLRSATRMTWGATSGHDDYVASLALCLRAAHDLGPPRVALGRAQPRA